MSMERVRPTKIDLNTARLARVYIPPFEEPIDGILPAEEVEMVVAQGKGKFAGETMVQIGHMSCQTKAPIGFVYRQPYTYQGFRRGRDIFIDPSNLKEGIITTISNERGLWVRLEGSGRVLE